LQTTIDAIHVACHAHGHARDRVLYRG
jgi:hypothetical protein